MDQKTLSYIKQNINQLIKNSDTALFLQVQACIVPKYEKVPSMFTIPEEHPPIITNNNSTKTSASTSLASSIASTMSSESSSVAAELSKQQQK